MGVLKTNEIRQLKEHIYKIDGIQNIKNWKNRSNILYSTLRFLLAPIEQMVSPIKIAMHAKAIAVTSPNTFDKI